MSDQEKVKGFDAQSKEKDWGGLAFIPLILFMVVYLGCGIVFTMLGVERGFYKMPAVAILLVCFLVALFMGKRTMDEKIESFSKAVGDPGVMMTIMIFLLAGAFSGVATAAGSVASTVNLGLTLIPSEYLLAGVFIISCFIGFATGTSMGTVAAMAPIALGLANGAGLDVPMAISGVVAGALFGDNLSIVSDTTIAATRGVGCEMKDKFKMNFLIVLPAAVLTIIVYSLAGQGTTAVEPQAYSMIKVLPYVLVIGGAIAGFNVALVLIAGIVSAGFIGMYTGALDILTFATGISDGMGRMAGTVFIIFFIRGIMGLVVDYGGVQWMINTLTRDVKSARGAQYSMSALAALLVAALANTTIAIIIAAPLAKEIGAKYDVEPRRSASLLDIFSTSVAGFLPYGGQILAAGAVADVSPMALVMRSFYCLFVLISALITIRFTLYKRLKHA